MKVEVNPLQRGTLWPVRKLACTDAVQEAFESFVELPVVSHAELFGGKVSAALDRQHPRDLFDVRQLLDVEGFGDDVRAGLLMNLIGHRRPIAELLNPQAKDQRQTFAGEFAGMTLLPFDYAIHEATFAELTAAVRASLTARGQSPSVAFGHSKTCGFHGSFAPGTGSLRCGRLFVHSLLTPSERAFLLSFEEGSPDWSLFPAAGAERLPAPRWKLLNIQKLRSDNPAKHAAALKTLRGILEVDGT